MISTDFKKGEREPCVFRWFELQRSNNTEHKWETMRWYAKSSDVLKEYNEQIKLNTYSWRVIAIEELTKYEIDPT